MIDSNARVAVVTGAGRGLGRAIATRLVGDGFRVVVVDIADSAIETAHQINAVAKICDITDSEAVGLMFGEIRSEIGPVSILINNAGVNDDARLVQMSDDQWRRVLDVNLTATFNCTRIAAQDMLDQEFGRIVNMSSIGVLGNRNTANYAAAKAGIIGFTRAAALEFASRGVTVNAVAPGVMDTDMYSVLPETIREALHRKIPAKRIGKPEEIAAAIAFLVSRDADYITGQVLFVDGGISLGYM